MRQIDKIAEEQFDGDVYKAIEYVYETYAHEKNPIMDKIYSEFTQKEREIACEVIKNMAIKKTGQKAVDDIYESVNIMERLHMSDEEILSSEKNPFGKTIIKYVILMLCVISVPLILMFFTKNLNIKLFGIELDKILSLVPMIGITPIAIKLGPAINNYCDFKRLKKYLLALDNGGKVSLQSFRISWISCIFLGISIIMFAYAVGDLNTLKDYKNNGTMVSATICDVDWDKAHENFEVTFIYEHMGKEYSYIVENYHGGHKMGKTVDAYIYPDKPENLYLPAGNLFIGFFMFFLAVLFSWVENGLKKNHLPGGILVEGVLMCVTGLFYGLNSWLYAGMALSVFMLIIILLRNLKGRND